MIPRESFKYSLATLSIEENMSEYIYEQRNINAWNEYQTLNGRVDFETFMARHVRVNEWIVAQMPTGNCLENGFQKEENK